MSLRFVLFGHPVAHSLSPVIHHAAYAALGLPHRYELVDAPDAAALADAVRELKAGSLAGANVTIPWKREALALADHAAASAADVGAANVLVRSADGAVTAHNTDVPALAREVGLLVPAPAQGLVLGSGGAALAAVAALQQLGARRVGVTARRFDVHVASETWPHGDELRRLGAELLAWPGAVNAASGAVNAASDAVNAASGAVNAASDAVNTASAAFDDFATGSQVIVQATSAGMHGAGPGSDVAAVVPWPRLARGTLAYNLVYNPAETEFLRQARAHGCLADGGLGMLVGQAAFAFELWLGVEPPRAAMRRAAEAELARRRA